MTKLIELISTVPWWIQQRTGARDKGASMVEYGLIITLIALVVFVALLALGPQVANLYTSVQPYF